MATIIDQLTRFTRETGQFSELPGNVVQETKRVLLDSFGCALAAIGERGAEIGLQHGRQMGAGQTDASVIGTGDRLSIYGAAFANGELINALDFDAVLPPGHVAPYVIPGALAVAEQVHASGRSLISAIAVAQEMSYRIGKAMDYLRDVKNGKPATSDILGFSATIFGATAAIGQLRDLSAEQISNGLGLAGTMAPVNSHRAWVAHAPATTIKYMVSGHIANTAITASALGELGHRGDVRVLDDRDYGYPKFIGTKRWVPETITENLGREWGFPAEQSFKPYPHCRVPHALFDALTEIVETNDIKPDEIESIKAWGEAWVMEPLWLNTEILDTRDAQFSIPHGLAVAAQRIKPGKDWQTPEVVFNEKVLDLMSRSTFEPHPDYVSKLQSHPSARQSRIEVAARGTTFTAERSFPKGSPSTDPNTYYTDEELIAKFRHNGIGVLSDSAMDEIVDLVMNLDQVSDITSVTSLLSPTAIRN